ncbi:MAG: galactokinase [Gemmatimonadales bacterium]
MAAPAAAGTWEAATTLESGRLRLDPHRENRGHWSDYLAGVIRRLGRIDAAPPGARLAIASDVPVGGGLSSSAALCVSLVKALSLIAGRRLGLPELVDIAFQAEHDEVGVRVGRMDQTAVTYARSGQALLFETGTGSITMVPMHARVWVLETGVSHRLTGGDYNQRRGECEEALTRLRQAGLEVSDLASLPVGRLPDALGILPVPLSRRVRHVVTETARTRAAAEALRWGDLETVGRLLVEGHASLRDDYQSSCAEADLLVESAVRHGAWGARITGAGWGGSCIMLAPPADERRIAASVREEFEKAFGRAPNIWWSKASGGVRRERGGR